MRRLSHMRMRLHMRMRKKVNGWLQVLNRAFMPAEEKEKKTSSGKTFTRK